MPSSWRRSTEPRFTAAQRGGKREGTKSIPRLARALLLVENAAGYANLCRLLTLCHLDPDFALVDDLPAHSEGLVVLTPSRLLLARLAEVLDADTYLGAEYIAHAAAGQRHALLETARRVARPVVGSHRVFLEHPTQHEAHRTRLAIAHLKFLREIQPDAPGRDGDPLDLAPPQAWLMPPHRAVRAFRHLPHAAKATLEVAATLHLSSATLDTTALATTRTPRPRLGERPNDGRATRSGLRTLGRADHRGAPAPL